MNNIADIIDGCYEHEEDPVEMTLEEKRQYIKEAACDMAERDLWEKVGTFSNTELDEGEMTIPDLQDESERSVYKEKYQDMFNEFYDQREEELCKLAGISMND